MAGKMLRIAVITVHSCPLASLGGRDTGGMNVYVRELGRRLGNRGFGVDIFTCWHDRAASQIEEFGENARVIHLEAGERGVLAKQSLYQYLPQFAYNLCQFKESNGLEYDLVHSHYWLSGWVAALLKRQWRVPHIATFHTLGEMKRRARLGEHETELRIETEKRVIAASDCIIATSQHEKNQMVRLYGASPGKIEVIPCGVDLSFFRPIDKAKAQDELGFTKAKLILFVGRIEPLKGIDLLLRAVARLEDARQWHLLVVGGDNYSKAEVARLGRLAAELGVGEKVSFMGSVEHERLPLFYNAAALCVVPSYYESFGLVALEAMACGTPVVASRVGGLGSIVRDGETGYLIPWRCPEPFAERIELLLGNEALRNSFGLAARAWVECFDWSIITEQVIQVYLGLARGSASLKPAHTRALSFSS